jgi:hypothetical protein
MRADLRLEQVVEKIDKMRDKMTGKKIGSILIRFRLSFYKRITWCSSASSIQGTHRKIAHCAGYWVFRVSSRPLTCPMLDTHTHTQAHTHTNKHMHTHTYTHTHMW